MFKYCKSCDTIDILFYQRSFWGAERKECQTNERGPPAPRVAGPGASTFEHHKAKSKNNCDDSKRRLLCGHKA
jgi:hypothetical protein